MPRGKRAAKPKQQSTLQIALAYLALAQRNNGELKDIYCRITQGWGIVSTDVVTLATPVEDAIEVCPNTLMFLDALNAAPQSVSMTQIATGTAGEQLGVRSGTFNALVPCVQPANLPILTPPDPPQGVCDARLMDALKLVIGLASDRAKTVLEGTIQFSNQFNSVLATNRQLVLEAWHGINLPIMALPKQAASILIQSGKNLHKIGYSGEYVTFYFDDNSWLRSKLHNDFLPALNEQTNRTGLNLWPIPKNLFEAVSKLARFSIDDTVLCRSNRMMALNDKNELASVEVNNIPDDVYFSISSLKELTDKVDRVHWGVTPNISVFYGDKVRAAIAHKKVD